MRRTPWIIGLIAPALVGVRAIAGAGAPAPPGVIPLRRCTIEYSRSTLVGSNQYGLIRECLVRPGDRVKGGQVLGRLFDQDALAELESRTVALEGSQTTIHQGEETLEVERTKLRRAGALHQRRGQYANRAGRGGVVTDDYNGQGGSEHHHLPARQRGRERLPADRHRPNRQ